MPRCAVCWLIAIMRTISTTCDFRMFALFLMSLLAGVILYQRYTRCCCADKHLGGICEGMNHEEKIVLVVIAGRYEGVCVAGFWKRNDDVSPGWTSHGVPEMSTGKSKRVLNSCHPTEFQSRGMIYQSVAAHCVI